MELWFCGTMCWCICVFSIYVCSFVCASVFLMYLCINVLLYILIYCLMSSFVYWLMSLLIAWCVDLFVCEFVSLCICVFVCGCVYVLMYLCIYVKPQMCIYVLVLVWFCANPLEIIINPICHWWLCQHAPPPLFSLYGLAICSI